MKLYCLLGCMLFRDDLSATAIRFLHLTVTVTISEVSQFVEPKLI